MLVESGLDVLEHEVEVLSTAEDPPLGGLGEALLRLGHAVERLAALRAAWSTRFEASGEWASDGARSGAAWVAARALEHPARARARVHAGRDMADLPLMAEAALQGAIRLGHVRVLAGVARAKDHRWAALGEFESLAVQRACELNESQFARFVDRWGALVDASHDEQLRAEGVDVAAVDHAAADRAQQAELYLSQYGAEGMWALNGTLDPETGLALSAALESLCEAIRAEDRDRDLPRLRHDALGVLLNGRLCEGLPTHKGVRPHVMVLVGPGSRGAPARTRTEAPGVRPLVGACPGPQARHEGGLAAPGYAELFDRSDGTTGTLWLTGLARQRLTCDAVVQTLTLDSAGIPLALGRSVRVVPPALRRVLDVRDRQCTFAGCTAPPIWCQAHHLTHWEDGGPTDERNLVLLCSFHHRAVHERGFRMEWTDAGRRLRTIRPDGREVRMPAERGDR